MENRPICFSRFHGRGNSILTKQYHLNDNGGIRKDSTPNFSIGTAETICINKLSDIESKIENLDTNECISTGVFGSPSCEIVTNGMLDEERRAAGVRSRTRRHMVQPPSGIALLDHDISPYMPDHQKCGTPSELISKMQSAIPRLELVAFSGAGSCSNGITVTATNKPYKGGGGLHVYLSTEDVELLGLQRYLVVNLWIAGFGYIAFARNGAMLERCIIDPSVLSPERLIYEAPPILGDGLSRRPREWQHRGGTAFSGDLSLTQDQINEYERLVANAKADPANKAKSDELAAIYHEGKVDALAEHKSISRDEARKLIPQRSPAERDGEECILHLNDIIEIQGKHLTVSELLERGSEFDGLSMPDPVEGSSYGDTTAKFYFNDGQSPCIHSFAHGMKRIYKLGHSSGFEPCEYQMVESDGPPAVTSSASNIPFVAYSLQGMSEQLSREISDQKLILGLIILMYQSSVIYAAPNTGKSLIILWLLINAIKRGKIDPSCVFYFNLDDTPNGLIEKLKMAEKYGFHILAEGYNDFKAAALLVMLADLVENNRANGIIIILDTLKKFTDLMDKRMSSRFGKAIRNFVMKGGTCISLAHTNKHRNSDGKPIYAGTTDIIDDADCAYLMYEIGIDVDAETKTIQFENIKSRGSVAKQVAYRYSISEGLSYPVLFDSVEPVDDAELSSLEQSVELESDIGLIEVVTACIREGIDTKMRLAEAASERSGASKRAVLRLLDKYSGSDPDKHLWNFQVHERGAKKYCLLTPDTTVTDHVVKP